ncbi:MAG: ABC transporter permease [Acidimicrobiales bacterium]
MSTTPARDTTPGTTSGTALRITPAALLGSRRAVHMVERNVYVYRRSWIFLVSGFFEPFFYLLSIGIGMSSLVGPLRVGAETVAYPVFVAPGLLASSAMNGALFDSTFNLFHKLKFAHTYDAVLSTPLTVADVAVGEMGWSLLRSGLYALSFMCAMAALGDARTSWAALCYPEALLVAFAFSAVGMATTTYLRGWRDFEMVMLAIVPMFLFSATFYPLSVYPGWLQAVVRLTPLYQGVALLRGTDLGSFQWAMAGHAAYLAILGLAGLAATRARLGRLLLP